MKRRSRAGGKTTKARDSKTVTRKHRDAPKAGRRRDPATADLQEQLDRRTRELNEALQQQTATADVLKVISRSTFDLQTVLDTLVQSAARLCESDHSFLFRREGENYVWGAYHGFSDEYLEYMKSRQLRPERGTAIGRAALDGQIVHIPDVLEDAEYTWWESQKVGKYRAVLAVPLMREGLPIGVLGLTRLEPQSFTDKQIELLTTFADQAVIAIENVRLFEAEQQRTRELTESLEQQTATSEVLQVISSSPDDLQPVFTTMLEKAVHICDAKFAYIYRWDGDALDLVATYNVPPAFAEARRGLRIRPKPGMPVGRMLATKTTVHVTDVAAEPIYTEEREPAIVAAVELGGVRTLLAVPMLKEQLLIGAISIYRQEVRPFTDKQIALVSNFAAQAVIAIENARLLSELRQRTAELTESLEQQTATSEVLQVISGSPGDLEPVFAAMLENAVRICDAKFGNIYRWDGETGHLAATHNTPPAFAEHRRRSPHSRPNAKFGIGRMFATKTMVHVADAAAEEGYLEQRDEAYVAAVELGGVRTYLAVPMLKENELIGGLTLSRQEVRPFTDKQIALVTSFAAQAVIAIENARLLSELRESLQEQTATAEVLQVINSSSGDLEPVFAAMLEKAIRICDANFGNIYRWDGEVLHLLASHNTPPALADARKHSPLRPYAETPVGRMVVHKAAFHSADMTAMPGYIDRSDPGAVAAVELGGVRTILAIPMLKENEMIGSFSVYRQEVRPFTDKQIALVTNFAAQAVIAIENARLLKELRERTEEVGKLNQQLEQRVADQVGEIERMSRLRRFLPPQVADLIVASGAEKQLESHRREITALFCDLRGFTGFSESSDPEDVMALLREYHVAIGEIIIRYSGTLERYAGDGVMVVFNDPIPVDSPALQAVQMALEMREAIGALTERWRQLGHEIGFGIGIAHGYATLGTIGFEGRFDYAAIGTVSNVASRLCDEAKPGQILISPRVLMAVRDAVTVEAVGEFELKGIRRPIAAYNVLSGPSQTH